MFNFLKEYFTFSRGERNGIIVLLLIIVLLILLPRLYEIYRHQTIVDFTQFQREIKEFENQQALAQDRKSEQDTGTNSLFNFDPNEITENDWKKLGVNDRTIRIIMNYRHKGGLFEEKEDLLKIYGFDTAKYEMLEPYIVITDESAQDKETYAMNPFEKPAFKKPEEYKQSREKNYRYEYKDGFKPKENVVVELNAADSVMLVKVNGIGPVLSKRIIKYRDVLGGFVNLNQVMEVYGMDSAWFQTILPHLKVDSALVSKIPINSISLEELQRHPYFRGNVAKTIVNYREQHGDFVNLDDLKKIYLIDEKLFIKIKPYITLNAAAIEILSEQ